MPVKLLDQDGNEVEAYTAEEYNKINTDFTKAQETIKTFEDKNINFKSFKELTEEEKSKLSAEKLAAMKEAQDLKDKIANIESSNRERTLKSAAKARGLTEEEYNSVMAHMNSISDNKELGYDSETDEGLAKKFDAAMRIAIPNYGIRVHNPITAGTSGFGMGGSEQQNSFADSEAGTSIVNKLLGK